MGCCYGPGLSPGKPVDRRLCQAATAPGDTHLLREIPFKDVDFTVHVSVDHGTALVADIEATMETIGSTYCAAHAACLACVVLGFLDNADASKPGLVREHPDDLIEWPFVELLIPAISPVFAITDVRKVPQLYQRSERLSTTY